MKKTRLMVGFAGLLLIWPLTFAIAQTFPAGCAEMADDGRQARPEQEARLRTQPGIATSPQCSAA